MRISISTNSEHYTATDRILDGRTSKAASRRARYGHGRRSWRSDCSSGQVSFATDRNVHRADVLAHCSGETVHISALALLKVGAKSEVFVECR